MNFVWVLGIETIDVKYTKRDIAESWKKKKGKIDNDATSDNTA